MKESAAPADLQLRQALLHSGGSPLFATVYVRAAALINKSDQPADALKRKKFAQLIADLADAKCNLIMCVFRYIHGKPTAAATALCNLCTE